VIGSLAVTDPRAVLGFFDEFGGERITLALDVTFVDEVPIVATSGWTQASGRTLWDVAARFPDVRQLLVTDIGRDGMMGGPNLGLIEELAARFPGVTIQASGGVSSLADLVSLADAGAGAAIVGKAIWEGKFELSEAIAIARR